MHKNILLDNHTIAYKEHNPEAQNTPIIYIHGILNSIRMQEIPLSKILHDQHWIALSLPGHYPAKAPANFHPQGLTPEFIGNTLSKAIYEIVGEQPVRLIGHSTGGFSSLTIAHQAPNQIQDVCLVDAFAQGKWYSLGLRPLQIMANLPLISRPLFSSYVRSIQGKQFVFDIFYYAISHSYKKVRQQPDFPAIREVIMQDNIHLETNALYAYFNRMPGTDIRSWLPEISCPVTIVHGDNDPVILPEHAREMDNLLQNSNLIWLPNCGHDPFTEKFDNLKVAIREWL